MRRRADSNRRIKVLQTSPLPLGYGAKSIPQLSIFKLTINKNPVAWWEVVATGQVRRGSKSRQPCTGQDCRVPRNRWGRAGNGTRTRDINLGKVALYQLSYSRNIGANAAATSLSNIQKSAFGCNYRRRVRGQYRFPVRESQVPTRTSFNFQADSKSSFRLRRFHVSRRTAPRRAPLQKSEP